MNKDELDIIKKVIEEEGMRRDIGLMIDQAVPVASQSWWSTIKGKVFIASTILVVGITTVYFLTSKENTNQRSQLTSSVADEENQVFSYQEETAINSDVENLPKKEEQILQVVKEFEQSGNTGNNVKRVETLAETRANENSSYTKVDRTLTVAEKSNNDIEQGTISIEEEESDLSHEAIQSIDSKSEEVALDQDNEVNSTSSATIDGDQDIDADNNSSIVNNEQGNEGNEGENDDIELEEEVKKDNSSNPNRITGGRGLIDFSVGAGYTFLSTGDIRGVPVEIGAGYQITNRLAVKGNGAYGRGTSLEIGEEVNYIQAGAQLYFSPFRNNLKNDFRIGAGPTYYKVNQTYLTSTTVVGGVVVSREYETETRSSPGITFIVEDRVMVSEVFFIGASAFMNRFSNEDLVSGVQLTMGYKF